jgi:stage II sporulation protein D
MNRTDVLAAARRLRLTLLAEIRSRPHRIAGVAAAVVLLAFGVWSCQTMPGADRGTLAKFPEEPEMRVRIKAGVQSVSLSGPAEFVVQTQGAKPLMAPAPLSFVATAKGCDIKDGQGKSHTITSLAPVDVFSGAAGSAGSGATIKVDGVSYPGHIRIVPRGEAAQAGAAVANSKAGRTLVAKLDVIEYLPIEEYLMSVVGSELYKDWPLAAYQTQAVCARTYALHERERVNKLGRDFDVESTTADQVYSGGNILPVARQAIEDTRGVVVTWQGRLLRTYYSSTCGGRTMSAADVWPTGPGFEFNLDPPIQAHTRQTRCEASPRYRWESIRDRTELSRRIREWGKANAHPTLQIGLVNLVSIDKVNTDSRPRTYTLADDQRKIYTIGAEQLRQACNQAVSGLPEITRETRVWSSDFEIEVRGAKVTIRGRGFGHGVGMCQFCIKGMADQQVPWRDMTLLFYPGAKLERAY